MQLFARERDGLVDVVELFFDVMLVCGQVVVLGIGGRGERAREGGTLFGQHLYRHAHCLRDDEDVAEDDGGVDEVGIAVDRLEGQGGRDLRGAATGEEVVRTFGVVVFGEVAACLSHDPYWWSVYFLASSSSQEPVVAEGLEFVEHVGGWVGLASSSFAFNDVVAQRQWGMEDFLYDLRQRGEGPLPAVTFCGVERYERPCK